MKAIQITFDERLLEKLDSDEEVKREGRSAVIRRAVADYLRKKRRATIGKRLLQLWAVDLLRARENHAFQRFVASPIRVSPKVLTSGRSSGPRASVRTGVRLHIVPTTGSRRL